MLHDPTTAAAAASAASGGGEPVIAAAAVVAGSSQLNINGAYSSAYSPPSSAPASSAAPAAFDPFSMPLAGLHSPFLRFDGPLFPDASESPHDVCGRGAADKDRSGDDGGGGGGASPVDHALRPSHRLKDLEADYDMSVAERAVQLSCRLAERVQAQLRRRSGSDGGTGDGDVTCSKADKSFVTVADWGVQAVVSWVLRQAFPGVAISMVAEEDTRQLTGDSGGGGAALLARLVTVVNECLAEARLVGIAPPEKPLRPAEILELISRGASEGGPVGRHWILDPVDGTLGFVRDDQYAVALALLDSGSLKLGVLGCPNFPVRAEWLRHPHRYHRLASKLFPSSSWHEGVVVKALRGHGAFMEPLVEAEGEGAGRVSGSSSSDSEGRSSSISSSISSSSSSARRARERTRAAAKSRAKGSSQQQRNWIDWGASSSSSSSSSGESSSDLSDSEMIDGPTASEEDEGCVVDDLSGFDSCWRAIGRTVVSVRVSGVESGVDALLCEPVEGRNSNHGLADRLADRMGISHAPLRVYSMAKYTAVARGDADIFLKFPRGSYREKVWDHAAGVAVVEEAGGVVSDAGGRPLDFSRGRFLLGLDRGIVASSGREIHQRLLEAIEETWSPYPGDLPPLSLREQQQPLVVEASKQVACSKNTHFRRSPCADPMGEFLQ